jgi:hypothetical protein
MMMAITGWYAVSVALAVQTLLGTLSATCSALCVTQEVCDTIMVLAGDALLVCFSPCRDAHISQDSAALPDDHNLEA